MEDKVELTGHMNEVGDIVAIKRESFVWEQMFNVLQIARDQIVHANHFKSIGDETITQV